MVFIFPVTVVYTHVQYKVPPREVPRGVAQENTLMKYLHTCLELHPPIINVKNTQNFEDRLCCSWNECVIITDTREPCQIGPTV